MLGAQRIESIVGKGSSSKNKAAQRNKALPNHERFFRNFLAQKVSSRTMLHPSQPTLNSTWLSHTEQIAFLALMSGRHRLSLRCTRRSNCKT